MVYYFILNSIFTKIEEIRMTFGKFVQIFQEKESRVDGFIFVSGLMASEFHLRQAEHKNLEYYFILK